MHPRKDVTYISTKQQASWFEMATSSRSGVVQLQIKRSILNGLESCRLPTWFVSSLGERSKPPSAVKVALSSVHVFAFWLGSTTSDERIEVSNEIFEAMRIKCAEFRDGSVVTVSLVSTIPIATEVHLKPKSLVDWDIVSTQAAFVESNLLKKLGIVSRDEVFCINISSSMKAQLQVQKIICKGQLDQEVVRITNETVLVIEPYTVGSCADGRVPRAQSVNDNDFQQSMKHYELRSIPHSWRLHAQHSQGKNNYSKYRDNEAAVVDLDECLKGLLDDFTDTHDSVTNSTYVWSNITPSDNLFTAYIHPLVIKTALEMALKAKFTWSETNEFMKSKKFHQWMGLVTKKIDCATTKEEEDLCKPIHNLHLVHVIITDQIRPYHISLPLNVQKVLQIADYEGVFLELFVNMLPTTLPSSITFRPLYWENQGPVKGEQSNKVLETKGKLQQETDNNSSSAFSAPKIKFLLPAVSKADLIAALIRCVENSSGTAQHSDVLFSHNCVVTLQVPIHDEKNKSPNHEKSTSTHFSAYKAIDFLVEFHCNRLKPNLASKGQLAALSYLKLNLRKQSEDIIARYINLFHFELNHPIKVSCPQKLFKQFELVYYEQSTAMHANENSIRQTELCSHVLCTAYPKCIQLIRDRVDLMFHQEKVFEQFYFRIFLNAFQVSYICCNTSYHQYHHPSYSLLQMIATEFQESTAAIVNYQAHVEYVSIVKLIQEVVPAKVIGDKVTLTVPQVNAIFNSIQTIFERAKERAPSIVCIEDLDVLCPDPDHGKENAMMSSSAEPNVSSHQANSSSALHSTSNMQSHLRNAYKKFFQDERIAMVVSIHLYRIWKDFATHQTEYQKPFFTRMYEKFHASTNKSEGDYRDLVEKCVTRQLQSTVYVIASISSFEELNPILGTRLHDSGYWKATVFALDTWSLEQRYATFLALLSHLRITCVTSTQEQKNNYFGHFIPSEEAVKVQHAIDGMNLYELERIGNILCDGLKRIAWREKYQKEQNDYPCRTQALNYVEEVTKLPEKPRSYICTVEDILTSIEQYKVQMNVRNDQNGKITKRYQWSDFAGYKTVKESLLEIIQYPIIYARIYRYCPIKLPRAIMLYGIPGCGKTYLANIIGHTWFSANAFYTVRGPELLNKYIGTSEKAVRELFQKAVEQPAKSVLIYFDEFEALAPKRGKDNTGITDRIVNQLLTFIDGVESNLFKPARKKPKPIRSNCEENDNEEEEDEEEEEEEKKVYVLITTSRPDLIDTALLRPGRIEKHIYLGLPNTLQEYVDIFTSLLKHHINIISDSTNKAISHSLPEDIADAFQTILTDAASRSKLQQCTPADCKAVIDTAYLYAVHDIIDAEKTNAGGSTEDLDGKSSHTGPTTKVIIQGTHFLRAFQELRPSMRPEDFQFYQQIYAPFRKEDPHSTGIMKENMQKHIGERLAFH
jgi:SpoVK/Ycf46/Vps4 family AAA+-type ATPase